MSWELSTTQSRIASYIVIDRASTHIHAHIHASTHLHTDWHTHKSHTHIHTHVHINTHTYTYHNLRSIIMIIDVLFTVSMANKKEARGVERGRGKERGSERRRKDVRGDKQRRQQAREQVRKKECRGKERRQKASKARGNKDQDTNIHQGGKGRSDSYNLWKEERMKGAIDEYKE